MPGILIRVLIAIVFMVLVLLIMPMLGVPDPYNRVLQIVSLIAAIVYVFFGSAPRINTQ